MDKSEYKAFVRYNNLYHHCMHCTSQPLHTSDPTAVALIYIVLCWLTVDPNTASPWTCSVGRDSPVIIDSSMKADPVKI
jgi:hypothetical protein